MSFDVPQIKDRYSLVCERILKAAHVAGRNFEEIRLIVVTKGQPINRIIEVYNAGARIFGENYADQAVSKMASLAGLSDIEWHMIGHVQSRKAQLVCQNFDWMHSLDSYKLAQRLDKIAADLGRKLPVLLECNTSGELTKYGYPAWDGEKFQQLEGEIANLRDLKNLQIRGLMTVAPYLENPNEVRPFFQCLRKLQDYLQVIYPEMDWNELSMGMSSDFEIAVQEGATMVRIGEAILGSRPQRDA